MRIAGGEFLLYLFAEIVVTVFGFPKSMCEPELVDERAVNAERMTVVSFDLPFGNELPTKLPAAVLQQGLKRRADRTLVEIRRGLGIGGAPRNNSGRACVSV